MTKIRTRTYCLCLFCDYDRKVKGLAYALRKEEELKAKDFYDERDHIGEIMDSLGSDADYLGGMGRTTTWNVKEEAMPLLLRKIQDYNHKKEYHHIIQFELY